MVRFLHPNGIKIIQPGVARNELPYALINVGALDEAEKILTEAKGKKEVHQNVMSALVKLQTVKEEAEEAHTKSLNLANDQYQYLLGFFRRYPCSQHAPISSQWKMEEC
jgi:hypothetical protein